MAKTHQVKHHKGFARRVEHGVEAVGNTTQRVMKKVFR
jgi:hypothetical protein